MERMVGPFEVIEPLGAGGMGEVFKARDTRLNRLVALKFLPEAAGPLARERFQREALAIAALNHPHICTLHEVGEDGGRPYLVLELLEGESLKMRLRRGPLAPEQVLDWGLEIAEALDAAHHKGVLHRDLKPDNLWVTTSGHIKVLDFGLARLELEDPVESATIGADRILTSPGVAMGTIPYMSPEQAKGEPLDARSDIFSFGSVFYEMASGRLAFPGRSAAETSAAILKDQPPRLGTVRPEIPPKLEDLTNRCLEKDPELRYQSAADLRGELKRLKRESGSASTGTAAVAAASPPRGRGWLWPAAAALIVVAAGLAYWLLRPHAAPPELQFRQLTFSGQVADAVLSPDGKFLAHVDNGPNGTSLRLMSVATGSDTQIMPPNAGCCQSPSFSPDGNMVYFVAGGALRAIPVLGGEVRTIAADACSGAGFSPDGRQIAYTTPAAGADVLMVARADGSQARVLSDPRPAGYDSHCWVNGLLYPDTPAWSPDGRWVAVDRGGAGADSTDRITLVDAATGRARDFGPRLGMAASDLAWTPDGSGLLLTVRMPETAPSQVWELTYPAGTARQLTHDLQGYDRATVAATAGGTIALIHAAPQFSVWRQAMPGGGFEQLSGGGSDQDGVYGVAWTPQGEIVSVRHPGDRNQLWVEDGTAAPHPLPAGNLPATFTEPRIAPNGRIVIQGFNAADARWNLWSLDPQGAGAINLTPGLFAVNPVIVQDGRAVAFMNDYAVSGMEHQRLWMVPLDGGAPHQVWAGEIYSNFVLATDQQHALVLATSPQNPNGVFTVVPLDGSQPATARLAWMRTWAGGSVGESYHVTPDGRAFAAVVSRGIADNIWAFPLDASPPYALTHFTDQRIAAYAFSKDGRLAISRGNNNSDVVLATAGAAGNRN